MYDCVMRVGSSVKSGSSVAPVGFVSPADARCAFARSSPTETVLFLAHMRAAAARLRALHWSNGTMIGYVSYSLQSLKIIGSLRFAHLAN